jgi:hypothetical protein
MLAHITPSADHVETAKLPETWAGKRLRELDEAARNLFLFALSHEAITLAQRERALLRAVGATYEQLMAWAQSLTKYALAVKAGQRQPKPEPENVPTVEAEVEVEVAELAEAEVVAVAAVQGVPVVRMQRPQLRKAKRIPDARLARLRATAQAKRDAAEQLANPTPMWQPAVRLTALPGGLHWSGQGQVPGLGQSVAVERNGHVVSAHVAGYFHAEGFLGIVADYDAKVPAKVKQLPRAQFVFGRQIAQAA